MKTYWDNEGRYRALYQAVINGKPDGKSATRPRLERLRRAVNAYHDIYSNGGGNRDRDIEWLFNLRLFDEDGEKAGYSAAYDADGQIDWPYVASKTEPAMDKIILAAAEEAFGITIKENQK